MGGIREIVVDTATLSPDEARELERLVGEVRLLRTPPQSDQELRAPPGAPACAGHLQVRRERDVNRRSSRPSFANSCSLSGPNGWARRKLSWRRWTWRRWSVSSAREKAAADVSGRHPALGLAPTGAPDRQIRSLELRWRGSAWTRWLLPHPPASLAHTISAENFFPATRSYMPRPPRPPLPEPPPDLSDESRAPPSPTC